MVKEKRLSNSWILEELRKFVDRCGLFEGDPNFEQVDQAHFGYLNTDLLRSLDPDTKDGMFGMWLIDELEGIDFIGEIKSAGAVTIEHPRDAPKIMLHTVFSAMTKELAKYSDEIPGPEDGRLCIKTQVPIKVSPFIIKPPAVHENDVGFCVKIRVTCARSGM